MLKGMHASREGLREAHVEGPKPSPNVWAGGGLAPSPVRVEEPEQRQTTAQKASYAALFRNMCASGGGNACKPGGAEMRMHVEDAARSRSCLDRRTHDTHKGGLGQT